MARGDGACQGNVRHDVLTPFRRKIWSSSANETRRGLGAIGTVSDFVFVSHTFYIISKRTYGEDKD